MEFFYGDDDEDMDFEEDLLINEDEDEGLDHSIDNTDSK